MSPAPIPRTECIPVASPTAAPRTPPTRLRSFSALRETHSRNRYMTAMKPHFKATDTGSRATASIDLEDHLGRPECDHVPGCERLGVADGAAVEAHAVGGAQVPDGPGVPVGADLGVAARDIGVAEHDVAVAAAP